MLKKHEVNEHDIIMAINTAENLHNLLAERRYKGRLSKGTYEKEADALRAFISRLRQIVT